MVFDSAGYLTIPGEAIATSVRAASLYGTTWSVVAGPDCVQHWTNNGEVARAAGSTKSYGPATQMGQNSSEVVIAVPLWQLHGTEPRRLKQLYVCWEKAETAIYLASAKIITMGIDGTSRSVAVTKTNLRQSSAAAKYTEVLLATTDSPVNVEDRLLYVELVVEGHTSPVDWNDAILYSVVATVDEEVVV
jgi:hypothetical protein